MRKFIINIIKFRKNIIKISQCSQKYPYPQQYFYKINYRRKYQFPKYINTLSQSP